jgi:hypothetical protein
MVTSTRKRRRTTLALKLGETRVNPLYSKFGMQWNAGWTSFIASYDRKPLFKVEDCAGHPTEYRLEFLCLPAEYLLAAHWQVNNVLKQVFDLVIRAGRTDPYIKFAVPEWTGTEPVMYRGCSFICGDSPARPENRLTYDDIGKYYKIQAAKVRLYDHVATCHRLGYFNDMPVSRQTPWRMHETVGGAVAYQLFKDALLNEDYSLEFMQRLVDSAHLERPTPPDVVDFMYTLHSTQVKVDLYQQGSTEWCSR